MKPGTPVNIVNQPYKLGLHQGKIYLEAHPYLLEDASLYKDNLTSVVRMLIDITDDKDYRIDWSLAKQVIHEMNGMPVAVGSINEPPGETGPGIKGGEQNAIKLRLDTELKKQQQ